MTSDPVEAEAVGERLVTAHYGGRDWLIPTDVDTWPLAQVQGSVYVKGGQTFVDYRELVEGLRLLTGEQWPQFKSVIPRRRDHIPASRAFAAAVGIPGRGPFGSIPALLTEIGKYPAAVEATLQTMGMDYRDRYRFTDNQRRLTLRQIYVHLYHADYDSPIVIARNNGVRHLSDSALVMMDLYERMTGERHPSRPLSAEQKAARDAAANKTAEQFAKYKKRHNKTDQVDRARENARISQGKTHA